MSMGAYEKILIFFWLKIWGNFILSVTILCSSLQLLGNNAVEPKIEPRTLPLIPHAHTLMALQGSKPYFRITNTAPSGSFQHPSTHCPPGKAVCLAKGLGLSVRPSRTCRIFRYMSRLLKSKSLNHATERLLSEPSDVLIRVHT